MTSHDPDVEQYRDPKFCDRLKQDWPEAEEQLHSGGWDMTFKLEELISSDLKSKQGVTNQADARLLDTCCGEGSTTVYFASKGYHDIGIDINENSISRAKKHAAEKKVGDLATFVVGSALDLPFDPESFHVIYGQDPDAFSLKGRLDGFKSCLKVLKSKGILAFHHHWIPGRGWPAAEFEAYCKASGSSPGVSGDKYVSDLKAAGFEVEVVEDINDLSTNHLKEMYKKMVERCTKTGEEVQNWLKVTVEYIDKGLPFGVRLVARKP